MATLTSEARERVWVYFGALIAPRAVADAVADVGERFGHRSPDPLSLLATAHTVLEEYGRVAFEVEVDVLVHDLGLQSREAAIALGVDVTDVEAALDEISAAAAALDVDRDTTAAPRLDTRVAAAPAAETTRRQRVPHVDTRDESDRVPARSENGGSVSAPEPVSPAAAGAPVPVPGDGQPSTVAAEQPSRRGPIIAVVAVFTIIAAFVVVASAIA